MKFAIGKKVRLKHTGESGKICSIISEHLVLVRLDDGLEIPVDTVDLFIGIAMKNEKKIKPPSIQPIEAQKSYSSDLQKVRENKISLVFVPNKITDAEVSRFEIFIVNDTTYKLIYQLKITFLNSPHIFKNDIVLPARKQSIGYMILDLLNESPHIKCRMRLETTAGIEETVEKIIKIKPKQFFSKKKIHGFFTETVVEYLLLNDPKNENSKTIENLKNYTKRVAKPIVAEEPDFRNIDTTVHPKSLSDFDAEIDLHIDKLIQNPGKLSKNEIVKIQLTAFEKFIDMAISLGVKKVFVIHGVGEGKLKSAIATRLIQLREIKSFKNEFHPRYGWGATEIEL